MSIDSIININITAKTTQMAQKGFGIPLILGTFDHPDTWKIRSFGALDELLEWEKKRLRDVSPEANESEEDAEKEAKVVKELREKLSESEVYKAAKVLFAQNPRPEKIKIGRVEDGEISTSFSNICDEDDDFYGVVYPYSSNDKVRESENIKILAGLIAAKRMMLGIDIKDLTSTLGAELKDLNNERVFCVYDPKDEHLASAWMGNMLPQSAGSASWAYQQLRQVKPYNLSTTNIDALKKSNINRYINIKDVGVTLDGRMASGKFIDIVRGVDWLHARMQERLFRLLVINKKIPYTLKGIDLVRAEILGQLKEAVYQGILAEDPEPSVSTPTVDQVNVSERNERILPKIRFSGRLQGAIHTIKIEGTVSV